MLSLLAPAPSGADASSHRTPTVLVLVQSSGQRENAPLSALIADSFAMELQSQGMRTLAAADHAEDDRAIATLAKKKSADFAIWATYVLVGSQVQLSARWIDPGTMSAAGHASRTAVLDFTFDAVVTSLVDEIVEGQKERIASLPPAPELPPAAAPAVKPEEKKAQRIPPFAISLSSAPFIATFTALNYFPVGLSVSLAGRYQLKAPGGLVGLGLAAGLTRFHGRGAYAEADFYVIPIGIDVLYGTRTGSAIDFFVHLAGGPAIFTATLASGESLAKVIPSVSGGVGIVLSPFDSLGISLEGAYSSYFDSPDPIMGFTPAISVVLRL